MERSRYHRAAMITGLAVVSLWAGSAQARSHPEGRVGVPAMVARVLPAVVSITMRQIERDQFNEPVPTRGLGSGFIVDRQGHVLTNNHVIEGAQEIKVALTDGRLFRATLVGADRFSDLAVLKIGEPGAGAQDEHGADDERSAEEVARQSAPLVSLTRSGAGEACSRSDGGRGCGNDLRGVTDVLL